MIQSTGQIGKNGGKFCGHMTSQPTSVPRSVYILGREKSFEMSFSSWFAFARTLSQTFTHMLTHTYTHTHSPTHTHSHTHPLTHTHVLTHSPIRWEVGSGMFGGQGAHVFLIRVVARALREAVQKKGLSTKKAKVRRPRDCHGERFSFFAASVTFCQCQQ